MNVIQSGLMIFVMTVSGTFGALFFKKASSALQLNNIVRFLLNYNLYIGAFFYLLGACMNIILLRYIDYSVLYPMTSLTYVWTVIVSYFMLGEKINYQKIIALFCIISGIVILNI